MLLKKILLGVIGILFLYPTITLIDRPLPQPIPDLEPVTLALSKTLKTKKIHAIASPLDCLSKNVYFEAQGETNVGKIAVAYVTLTRAGNHPSRICSVVYEHSIIHKKKICQFAWTCKSRKRINKRIYKICRKISQTVLQHKIKDPTNGATNFHNISVNPSWSNSEKMTGKMVIGNQIFERLY